MEEGRLYSRICGWENGIPVKFYNTEIIKIFGKGILNIDGKTGLFISNYMEKNDIMGEYPETYMICKTYPTWYFYYGESKNITSFEN
jgi:hypothetical protein